jgi:hypothetical protein
MSTGAKLDIPTADFWYVRGGRARTIRLTSPEGNR